MSIIRKTAAGKAAGSMTYVLSDATLDRYGDIIEPAGWDLRWFKKNPIALFNHNSNAPIGTWKNVRVEDNKLIAELEPAARGTSERIDEIISLIEQDVLRATSVGFRPIKDEPLDPEKPWRGTHFLEQELLETSLVSVPANPAALQLARSLNLSDETVALVFGEQAVLRQAVTLRGEHADPHPAPATRAPPRIQTMTIAQQIEAAQANLNTARDALTAFVGEQNPDIAARDALSAEIVICEKQLASLEQAERALAPRTGNGAAAPSPQSGSFPAPAIRRPLGLQMREPPLSDLFIRAAVCHLQAQVTGHDPLKVLDERYRDHEATQVYTRAAIGGATTTTAGWAAELVETATAAWLETLRPTTVYPRLAALGTSLSFGPGRGIIRLPSRASTPSISGSFVAEGAPIPVRRIGTQATTLSPHKMGVISVFSREIARMSNPQIEGLLRQEINADTSLTVDSLLLDANAASAVRPAGLVNGVVAITASILGGYNAFLADIQALAAPFDAANAGRALALIMNKAMARQVSMLPGPDGTFGWADRFLAEFSVLTSTTVPATNVYMVDAADFATATADAPEFETSEQAVLHMEDTTPLQIATGPQGTGVLATPTQSMFQTAQIALRMLLDISWAMRRTGMVQFITGANWAPVP